jgi:hypothetical protein
MQALLSQWPSPAAKNASLAYAVAPPLPPHIPSIEITPKKTTTINMKKNIILLALALITALPTFAQYRPYGSYRSRYARPAAPVHRSYVDPYVYYGLRVGANGATVSSDDRYLNGGSMKSGLNAGLVLGVLLSPSAPLFFETGVLYTEKGGKGNYDGRKFTYSLNYVEVPLVLKYQFKVADNIAIAPFLGGYLAGGVSGRIKDFGDRVSESSFNDYNFRRFDGGLRFGCGIMLDMFYIEGGYDAGLANICNDTFDDSHTGTLFASVGINF